MLDKIVYLEDGEIRYPMAFTMNVMEVIQEAYGTIQNWAKLVQNAKEPNIKALKLMVTEAINEGLDIEEKEERLTPKQVGRLITKLGIKNVYSKTNTLITSSVPEAEEKPKNARPMKNPKV